MTAVLRNRQTEQLGLGQRCSVGHCRSGLVNQRPFQLSLGEGRREVPGVGQPVIHNPQSSAGAHGRISGVVHAVEPIVISNGEGCRR